MKSLLRRVDWSLFSGDQPATYLLAVSGGADSVFLARAMAEYAAAHARPWTLVIAHVNHGVRGEEADHDERFVKDLAEELGFEFHAIRLDTDSLESPDANPDSREHQGAGTSLEGRLRLARWGVLAALARALQADAMVAAHQRDDLAETFFLQALRGAGLTGLASLQPRSRWEDVAILRPLLELGGREIREALKNGGYSWREDASNRDITFKRNWLRNEILPLIEERESGSLAAVARTAVVCGEEIAELQQQAQREYERIVPEIPRPESLARAWRNDRLGALSPVLWRHVLRRCVLELRPAPLAPSREAVLQWEKALDLSRRDGEERLLTAIPGMLIWISRLWIIAGPLQADTPIRSEEPFPGPVRSWLRDWRLLWNIPCLFDSPSDEPFVLLPANDKPVGYRKTIPLSPTETLCVEVLSRDCLPSDWMERWRGELRTGHRILADADSLQGDCILRPAKADERLFVFRGSGGTKTATQLLAEAHIPQPLRPLMPVVCDEHQPLAIPGIRRSTYGSLSESTHLVLHLIFEKKRSPLK